MDTKKQPEVGVGCVGTGDSSSKGVKGHRWSGWPGAYCLRCGAEQVLEHALALNWLDFAEGPDEETPGPEVWRSEDHEEIVRLCDDFCYADMTPDEVKAHKEKIKALCDKVGYGKEKSDKAPVYPVPQSKQAAAVVQEPGQGSGLG